MTGSDHASAMPAWLESAWLARYLERQLDPGESEWFEGYMLDKPHLLKAVNDDADLRDGVVLAAASFDARSSRVDAPVAPRIDPAPATVPHNRSPRWFAIAATLAIGVGAGWLLRPAAIGDGAAVTITGSPPRYVFDTLRGVPQDARVENVSSHAEVVIVDIAVPANAADVTLDITPTRSVKLVPGPDGFATAIVPRALLRGVATSTVRYRQDGRDATQSLRWPATR